MTRRWYTGPPLFSEAEGDDKPVAFLRGWLGGEKTLSAGLNSLKERWRYLVSSWSTLRTAPIGRFYFNATDGEYWDCRLWKAVVLQRTVHFFPFPHRPFFGICRDREQQTCRLTLKRNEWSPNVSKNAFPHAGPAWAPTTRQPKGCEGLSRMLAW